jgi:hypothetical protein
MKIRSVLILALIAAGSLAVGCDDATKTQDGVFGIDLEVVATCPNTFSLKPVSTYPQLIAADRNGDGHICYKHVAGCAADFPACGLHMVAIIDNHAPSQGDCLSGYEAVAAIGQLDVDQNGDQVICKAVDGEEISYTDNSF